uniref:Uncharacterized protein n=1 Tax=Arundo donax TaxID=35708 RepID=A0A0A9HFA1_ARUDO
MVANGDEESEHGALQRDRYDVLGGVERAPTGGKKRGPGKGHGVVGRGTAPALARGVMAVHGRGATAVLGCGATPGLWERCSEQNSATKSCSARWATARSRAAWREEGRGAFKVKRGVSSQEHMHSNCNSCKTPKASKAMQVLLASLGLLAKAWIRL